jgi:hypothetical protein
MMEMVKSFAYPASIYSVIMFYKVDEDRILLRMFNYATEIWILLLIWGMGNDA